MHIEICDGLSGRHFFLYLIILLHFRNKCDSKNKYTNISSYITTTLYMCSCTRNINRLSVLWSFFFCPLCCLSFYLRILITPLLSSNSSSLHKVCRISILVRKDMDVNEHGIQNIFLECREIPSFL